MQGILPMQQFKGVSRKEASWAKPCGPHKANSHLRIWTQPLPPSPKIKFLRGFRRCKRRRHLLLTGRFRRQVPAGGGDEGVRDGLRPRTRRRRGGSAQPPPPPPLRVVRWRDVHRRPRKPDLRRGGWRGGADEGGGRVALRRSRRVAGVLGGFPADEYSGDQRDPVRRHHRITRVDPFFFCVASLRSDLYYIRRLKVVRY